MPQKCDLSPKEINEFLALFRKLCSLFHLQTRREGRSFVVLQPTKFVKGLDHLYSSRASLTKVDRLLLNNGLLSESRQELFGLVLVKNRSVDTISTHQSSRPLE